MVFASCVIFYNPVCTNLHSDFFFLPRFTEQIHKLDDYAAWCETEYEADNIDVYSLFHSTDAALRCANRFLHERHNLYLIGVGLPKELEKANWCEKGESIGVEKRIEQHLPLETGGTVFGFEIVSYSSYNFGHSWWCNYIPKYMYDLFGIRYNSFGLLNSYDDAKKVYEFYEKNQDLFEPEPYDFWLMLSYPLNSKKPILEKKGEE